MLSPGRRALCTPSQSLATIPADARNNLREAREHERASRTAEAIRSYTLAVEAATLFADDAILAESLRRLAILRHRQGDFEQGRELCQRSYDVAFASGNTDLAAASLNTLGVQHLLAGAIAEAATFFHRALQAGSSSRELRARVEQNLGIIANIQGELEPALAHYSRSLDAFRSCGDEHGCAIAYHNLALISADRDRLDDAERYVRESHALAQRTGDVHLQGLCLVTRGEIDIARQRFERAQQSAEDALAIFNHLGSVRGKADAYRVIGMVYRETGRHALAESRLQSAGSLASQSGAVLIEAEVSREQALLYQAMGRNQDTLQLLNRSYRLFRRLNAQHDLTNVGGKVSELESTYFAVVRDWGRSIESRDSRTFGHCERVAERAVAMARALGLDEHAETTLLLGACLHDLGLLRVPHEILGKKEPLAPSEIEVVRRHPLWGLELLSSVEFPWDLKPIVRWHHERRDGSGYPDGLMGDEIPLGAQVVGILDLHDELTTGRFGEPALPPSEAFERVAARRAWWSDQVFVAFANVIGRS